MTVTVEDVALWAKLPDPPVAPSPEYTLFQQVIDSVVEHLGAHFVVASNDLGEATPEFFDARANQAVKMLSARLWGRRSNPYGVAEFADIAALRITKMDDDYVAEVLERRWGFA